MNKQLPNNIKSKLEILGYYQIVGGVIGLMTVIWVIAQTITITGIIILAFIFVTGLYSFSIYCGRLLIKEEYDLGLKLSIMDQALQIFSFAILGFAFNFVAGLGIGIDIDYTNGFILNFSFSLSDFQVNVNRDKEIIKLGFNFLAVFLIQYIIQIKDEIEESRHLQTPQIEQ